MEFYLGKVRANGMNKCLFGPTDIYVLELTLFVYFSRPYQTK